MQYLVFFPDEKILAQANFHAVAHVPVIFDENWVYHDAASAYMTARSKGEAFGTRQTMHTFPVKSSLGRYAYSLANFLEWCDWIGKPWTKIDYHTDLIMRYQEHMLRGRWSTNKQALSPSTINSRIDEATLFCQWGARVGLRDPLSVATRTFTRLAGGITSTSHHAVEITGRVGKVRTNPIHLDIPTPSQIRRWLKCVEIEKGAVKALMCELILATAMRREECVAFLRTTLPENPHDWKRIGDSVTVYLENGTKGKKPRYIEIPLEVANRLHDYRQKVRPKARKLYVIAGQDTSEQRRRMAEKEDRLFLSESTGLPVSGQKLYEAWTEISVKPYAAWSPHLGRHYWACKTLYDAYLAEKKLLRDGVQVTADWVTAQAQSQLLMRIKPQLGHIGSATTEAYLVWLRKITLSAEHSDEWLASLEGSDTGALN